MFQSCFFTIAVEVGVPFRSQNQLLQQALNCVCVRRMEQSADVSGDKHGGFHKAHAYVLLLPTATPVDFWIKSMICFAYTAVRGEDFGV